MSIRRQRFSSLLICLFLSLLSGLGPLVLGNVRALVLPNGGAAGLVLGQPGFTSSSTATTQSGMNGAAGAAVDPASGKVFVADSDNHRVLRFASVAALSNGANAEAVLGQASFSANTSACAGNRMYSPVDVATDSAGHLWVVERGNNRVLRFDSAASLASGASAAAVLGQSNLSTCTAGTGAGKLNIPYGAAVDSAGRLWLADMLNSRVLRFDSAASKPTGANADGVLGQPDFSSDTEATTQSGMLHPADVTVDTAGRLWVADYGNHRVLRFDSAAGKPNGANADGVLGQSNFTSGFRGAGSSGLFLPAGVAAEPASGRLWVSDSLNNRVLRFDSAAGKPNGASADGVLGQADFSTFNGGASATTFSVPFHLAFDPSRDMLWVADAFNHRALAFGILPATTVTPTRTTTSTPTPTTTPSVRPRAYLPIVHSP